jgi:hypothetical protein
MSAVAHGWKPTGSAAGLTVKVAKEFHEADKGKKWGTKRASGGMIQPSYFEKTAARNLYSGFLHSSVPGRTDKHSISVGSGSYVVPADTVSAVGQNNSLAGANVLKRMFGAGGRFGPRLKVPKFARGGAAEPVPIVAAGGEFVIPHEVVARIGNGDMKKGHEILDKFVMEVRKHHIKKLKSLPRPKK